MRILVDLHNFRWDEAWKLTVATLSYTNHTLLPEALETWPVELFERLLPRHLEIIYRINAAHLAMADARCPGDIDFRASVSLIDEKSGRRVRMGQLAFVGSHRINGVSAMHSDLMTNGITFRRWLMLANPKLTALMREVCGEAVLDDFSLFERLEARASDNAFQQRFREVKLHNKLALARLIGERLSIKIDPSALFDIQIKRIHEYKRQLLNALRIIVCYNRLRQNPNLEVAPRTFFFAGKAAPAYQLAKLIIKFVNNLAGAIDGDPIVRGRMKVVFLPEYNVSLAERLLPASDVSNQISTAGYEASGTSNMKFMMNGALTVGTRDGATIEMAEEAREENMFLFGLTVEQVQNSQAWYNPHWHYEHEPETRGALDLIFSDYFSRNEPETFAPIRETLLTHGDHYMHLADLTSYTLAQDRLGELYANPGEWARKAILNVASSGKFSSDRTIHEYATEIWKVEPCPIP
jgi:glycogen phosphorylase